MRKCLFVVAGGLVLAMTTPRSSEARVVRFVVEQTRPVADGKSFGDVGPYERLDGTVYIEVDPRDPLNAVIVNLDKAPRTPKGMVGFSRRSSSSSRSTWRAATTRSSTASTIAATSSSTRGGRFLPSRRRATTTIR